MPNFYLAKVTGVVINGTFTPIASGPVPIDDAFPYPDAQYPSGLNFKLSFIAGQGQWIITQISPTEKSYQWISTANDIDLEYIRFLLNDNQTTYDLPVVASNAAGPGNTVTKVYEVGVAAGSQQTMEHGQYNTFLDNAKYGARFSGLPASTAEFPTICKQIQIDGIKYDVNLPIENTGQIQTFLNGLGRGTYRVENTYQPFQITFDIYKDSRDGFYPQAVSIVYPDVEDTQQEVELVRAFELLDLVIDTITTVPILQREEDNCFGPEVKDTAMLNAKNVCPDCC